jgi:hypothetical protein
MEFVDAVEGPYESISEEGLTSVTEPEQVKKDLEAALSSKNEGNE